MLTCHFIFTCQMPYYPHIKDLIQNKYLVEEAGLEPARAQCPKMFKTFLSTNSNIPP